MSSTFDADDRIAMLERDMATLANQVGTKPSARDDQGRVVKDSMWKCAKCNSLLAYYDPEADVLRMRYKEHVMFARVGGSDSGALARAVGEWLRVNRGVEVGSDVEGIAGALAPMVDLGFVQIVCRSCSEVNTLPYRTSAQVEAEQAVMPEVTRRRRFR